MEAPTPNDVAEHSTTSTSEPEVKEDSFEPITSQEEFDKRLGARLAREREKYADYDDMKAELEKLESLSDELSETQKENNHLKEQLSSQEIEINKQAMAMEYNVPSELLKGTTREELNDSARALQEFARSTQGAQELVVDSVGSDSPTTLSRDDEARQIFGLTE